MNKYLIITQCPVPTYWYNDRIGHRFEICGERDRYYFICKDLDYNGSGPDTIKSFGVRVDSGACLVDKNNCVLFLLEQIKTEI